MTKIFDTHAHYNDSRYANPKELFESMAKSVAGVINCGTNYETSRQCIDIAKTFKGFCYAACGVHPEELEEHIDEQLLLDLLSRDECVAVGEIGLDYYYTTDNKQKQKDWFDYQLSLAERLDLPVIIHDREAHADTLDILKSHNAKGVLHCFSGSAEMAKEVLKMGFYIGIGGVVTFKNAKKTIEVVKNLPIDRLLLETDAPYLAPEPMRGKTNRSDYIIYVAEKIAAVKGIETEAVLKASLQNASNLFGIKILDR